MGRRSGLSLLLGTSDLVVSLTFFFWIHLSSGVSDVGHHVGEGHVGVLWLHEQRRDLGLSHEVSRVGESWRRGHIGRLLRLVPRILLILVLHVVHHVVRVRAMLSSLNGLSMTGLRDRVVGRDQRGEVHVHSIQRVLQKSSRVRIVSSHSVVHVVER